MAYGFTNGVSPPAAAPFAMPIKLKRHLAFGLGLVITPFSRETRGEGLAE